VCSMRERRRAGVEWARGLVGLVGLVGVEWGGPRLPPAARRLQPSCCRAELGRGVPSAPPAQSCPLSCPPSCPLNQLPAERLCRRTCVCRLLFATAPRQRLPDTLALRKPAEASFLNALDAPSAVASGPLTAAFTAYFPSPPPPLTQHIIVPTAAETTTAEIWPQKSILLLAISRLSSQLPPRHCRRRNKRGTTPLSAHANPALVQLQQKQTAVSCYLVPPDYMDPCPHAHPNRHYILTGHPKRTIALHTSTRRHVHPTLLARTLAPPL
jgi:hypothetical protein